MSNALATLCLAIFGVALLLFLAHLVLRVFGRRLWKDLGALCGIVALIAFFAYALLSGGLGWPTDIVAHVQLIIVGALIIVFLVAEPHGLAQLWRVAKEKLRLWPFPH